MNAIEHVCEPSRLVLTWQSPDLSGRDRKRFGVADLLREGNDAILVYRADDEVSAAKALGYVGYPAFRPDSRSHENALSVFKRRLPPRERSDFAHYLRNFRLQTCEISDFALLGYTEAKLPSDGFALVDRLEEACVPCERMLEIAGFRHYSAHTAGLLEGEEIQLMLEPDNPYDSSAIAFLWRGNKIGNVNRFQISTVTHWMLGRSVRAVFERRNGGPERPRGYAFVTVR
ncbi:HIRAN domain-containing protein [Brevundimonas lutea]|uniref:HIRAN domain-containing protein n=1 Tax=Brevundimonas lutea TaxID=2293980 RepID=UPI0013CE88E6|nr:HIRAN domain-containing protein [Brevundimonas lutea]